MSGEQKLGNVKVICRFRPLNERQLTQGPITVHELLDDKTVQIKDNTKNQKNNNAEPLKFSFDKVFDCNSTQQQVYDYAATSVIDSVIQGFNGTIFAYGQTSSGKTHTMQGQITPTVTEHSGIIPRMVVQVFRSISKCSENVEFRIKVSMVELYMEKLRDLIDTSKTDLKIRSDKKRGIFIQNITQTYISSPQEVYELMEVARNTRAIAATNMNERSSRSHLLFILTISQNNLDDMSAKTGKLYLVDLAGSEKVGKTGAEGKVLDEAKKINVSLTALGKVINALTDGKSKHVPYRDSKLTRVLQESLGGNSKTTLIVTCSPHFNNVSETISSLRFGVSAKKIKNKPKINKEMTVAQLQNLLQKIQKDLQDRQKYIEQLKNHIVVDLKQKAAPAYVIGNNLTVNEVEETDLMGQLQMQLQMQRNLNLVQEEQYTSLKDKYEKLVIEKEQIEQELNAARKTIQELNQIKIQVKEVKEQVPTIKPNIQPVTTNDALTFKNFVQDLEQMTDDDRILAYLQQKKNIHIAESQPEDYNKLLQDYENAKDANKKMTQKMQKQQKTMQKKLTQLQNNICQLTHAYYDLLIVQQRHKVDNIFLKKKIQEKDVSILSLKQKVKDLEDQNRDLQDQNKTYDDEDGQIINNSKKYQRSEDQENKLLGLTPNTKVVKVLRGGNK